MPWKQIFEWLWSQRESIRKFLTALKRQPVAFAISLILLSSSVGLTWWYKSRADAYELIVNRTFDAETEETPQSHKGLEALIFSNVRPGLDDAVKNSSFDADFLSKYAALEREIATIQRSRVRGKQIVLKAADSGGQQLLIDTDQSYEGYLFLPAFLVHAEGKLSDQKSDMKAITDPAIVKAVVFGRSISESLQKISGAPIIESDPSKGDPQLYLQPTPAQIYLVTLEGANRVFNRKSPHPAAEYENQFPATTFFPSRPYFWPALNEPLKSPSADVSIGKAFHVSKPYLDLGGSGVVITLSRPVLVGQMTAVLCIDLQIDPQQKNIYTDLATNIRTLGGTAANVTCTIGPNDNPECKVPESPADEQELIKRLKNALANGQHQKSWSTILGNLYIFETSPSRSRLRFSIPVKELFSSEGQKTELLLVDLDLSAYRRRTSWIAFGAATAFGLMTVLLAYLWGSNVMQRKELELALARVADVMKYSPTPYLHVDSTDKIKDASTSFGLLVALEVENVKGKTLRSFCADAMSQAEYDRIQRLRLEGLAVEPYILELRRKDNSITRVRVHSAALPNESTGLPETFGILIETSPSTKGEPGVNAENESAGNTNYDRTVKQ